MKVYVDELPKDCIGCPCESEYYCNLLNEDVGCCKWGEIHKNCPLQSLTDYTKQARKEVYEKIIKFINELAWEDVKYDAYQSTMGEFTGSPSAIPRYAKKYFDLWEEMFNEKLEQIEKGK